MQYREQAQKHYQKLTRELTQGQLLHLEQKQTFVQQASFVLLRGDLYVKGQSAGKHPVDHTGTCTIMVNMAVLKREFTEFNLLTVLQHTDISN